MEGSSSCSAVPTRTSGGPPALSSTQRCQRRWISLLVGIPLGELELVPTWPAHGYLLILALGIQVGGWLLISISLPRLPAAITSVVLTIQPVASVLLGIWILSEAPSSLQLVGVAFIIAGLLLVTVRIRSPRNRQSQLGSDPIRSDRPAG